MEEKIRRQNDEERLRREQEEKKRLASAPSHQEIFSSLSEVLQGESVSEKNRINWELSNALKSAGMILQIQNRNSLDQVTKKRKSDTFDVLDCKRSRSEISAVENPTRRMTRAFNNPVKQ